MEENNKLRKGFRSAHHTNNVESVIYVYPSSVPLVIVGGWRLRWAYFFPISIYLSIYPLYFSLLLLMLYAMGIISISNDIYLVEYDFTAAFTSLFIRFIAGSNDNEIQFPFMLPRHSIYLASSYSFIFMNRFQAIFFYKATIAISITGIDNQKSCSHGAYFPLHSIDIICHW